MVWEKAQTLVGLLVTCQYFRSKTKVVADLPLCSERRESPQDCIFRKIVEKRDDEGDNRREGIVVEDDKAVAIRDIRPSAETHLLVLPCEPIWSVLSLRPCPEDIELLEHMIELGKVSLRMVSPKGDESSWWMGFHVPPFTSVDHLHMHCLAGEYTKRGKAKFTYNRHFSVPADMVLERLRNEYELRQSTNAKKSI
uniref:HIT domain-containing protein n=1 Tax=Mucochytrium quahogii TaxID=96639 RepID=A0A7S2W3U3_9STRA|mmetsp:Transcript_1004/g.1618  ORF Transcript_1004/g.1618 Transcript_1004/m.1618 type:complete len:196 (+) Transcript_1004:255-842(+)